MERPPFDTDEATEGIEEEVGMVAEAVEDGNRSPDSISMRGRKILILSIRQWKYSRVIHK